MHWLHSNSRRVLVFTVGALIALGGIAYATIPDISGVISACYSSTSGALRVIDSAAKCSAAELKKCSAATLFRPFPAADRVQALSAAGSLKARTASSR